MSNKKYRLLKDAPEVKAGEIYEPQPGNKNWYVSKSNSLYHAATIENNPEWFEEVKEEMITVTVVNNGFCGEMVSIRPNRSEWKIPIEKNDSIKGAVEAILNGIQFHFFPEFEIDISPKRCSQSEVDKLMEDAFRAARKINVPWFGFMFETFQDYKNSLSPNKTPTP